MSRQQQYSIDKTASQVLPLLMFDVDINLTIVEVDINRHSEFLRRVYERDFTSQWNPAFLFIPIPAGSILIVKTLFDWRIIPQ